MNEREIRVLRALVSELRILREEIHAIREDQGPKNQPNNKPVQPLQVEIAATPQLDPARSEYYIAESNDRKSKWRKLKPWLEGVGVLIGFAIAALTLGTLNQVKRQADIAEADNRPWLKFEDITTNDAATGKDPILSFFVLPTIPKTLNSVTLQLKFRVKNIGKGVAQNVLIRPVILLGSQSSPTNLFGDEERKACVLNPNQRPLGPPWNRSAIFPNDEIVGYYGTSEPFNADKMNHLSDRPGDFLLVTVIGCIDYQSPRDYQTISVFHVIGPKDQFIEVNKPLSTEEMHLLRDVSYEYAQ